MKCKRQRKLTNACLQLAIDISLNFEDRMLLMSLSSVWVSIGPSGHQYPSMLLRSRKLLVAGLAALALTLMGGCETSPVTLSNTYRGGPINDQTDTDTADTSKASQSSKVCVFRLAHITDSRLDTATMGKVGPRVVNSPAEIDGWIRSAFVVLDDGTIQFESDKHPETGKELFLDVNLVKAWAQSINTSIATTIVLKVSYSHSNSVLKQAIYRGADTSLNWSNDGDDIQRLFDKVLKQALTGVRQDLAGLCSMPPT